MTILIIGLGSMGKRRIRCLQALGYKDIVGYDPRADRRQEATRLYGVSCHEIIQDEPSHVFVSTPPKYHREWSNKYKGTPTFIESGVTRLDCGTPSVTMLYNPVVQQVARELPSIGNIINTTYHCGQYLPDWHPYEEVKDFYVSKVGAWEMVVFELTWFCVIFNVQKSEISAAARNVTDIPGLEAADTISLQITSGNCIANLMIDVVSRKPIRQLVINGTEGQLSYDLNAGISEQMYIDETKGFMDGALPDNVKHNNRIIEVLEKCNAWRHLN